MNTNSTDSLWTKEELEQKTFQIEDELYDKLVELTEKKLDASVSKLINACIYDFSDKKELVMYELKDLNKHSIIFRKSAIEELTKLKSKFNIPQYVILNLAIREGIQKLSRIDNKIN